LEAFERDLTDLESRLQSESINFPTSDVQRMSSELTRTQTTIVTKRTKVETRLTTLSRLVEERKKKLKEIEDLEAMLGDLQCWTTTTQNIVDSKTDSDLSRKEISSKIEELEVNTKGDKVFFLKG
jgi:formate dehydrogenase maturation protein FdhE